MNLNAKKRLSWEEYALKMAYVASERSEDPYQQMGAVVLRHDNSIGGIGYNGAPPGINIDWSNREERLNRVLHAEESCLRYIKPNECYLIAITSSPCARCTTLIRSYGIKRIVYDKIYERDQKFFDLIKEFDIQATQISLNDILNKYKEKDTQPFSYL